MASASPVKVSNDFGITEEYMEELLNKKIEQIRLKNEETMKKHKMKEEDRKMAEQSGRSVTLQLNSTTKKLHDVNSERTVSTSVDEDNNSIRPDKNSLSHLRMKTDIHRSQTTRLGHEKAQVMNPKTKDVPESPPPDPSFNFLADRSRDGRVSQEASPVKVSSCRNHRNFGGNSFENAAHKVQHNRDQRHDQPMSSAHQSKIEYQLATTGKERLEYARWKSEQEKIDRERVRRHMNDSGEWRREWDRNKVSFESEDNKESSLVNHQTEQTRRPAGRIGSGRFTGGELQGIPQKEHQSVGTKDNRSSPNKRPSKPSSSLTSPLTSPLTSTDVGSRHVTSCNDSLVVKIANEPNVCELDRRQGSCFKDQIKRNACQTGVKNVNGNVRKDRQQSRPIGSGRISVMYESDTNNDEQRLQKNTVDDDQREETKDCPPSDSSNRTDRRLNMHRKNKIGARGGDSKVCYNEKLNSNPSGMFGRRDLKNYDGVEKKMRQLESIECDGGLSSKTRPGNNDGQQREGQYKTRAGNNSAKTRALRPKSYRKQQHHQCMVETQGSLSSSDLAKNIIDCSVKDLQVVDCDEVHKAADTSMKVDPTREEVKPIDELSVAINEETIVSTNGGEETDSCDRVDNLTTLREESNGPSTLLCESSDNIDLGEEVEAEFSDQSGDEDDQWEDVEADFDNDDELADNFEDSMCDVNEECREFVEK